MNPFYTHSDGAPVSQTRGTSATLRAEFDLVTAAFDAVSSSVMGAATESGTLNNYVLTLTPQPTAYPTKGTMVFLASHTNTGAATLQIGALTAIPLLANDGTALSANAIAVGELICLYVNGTNAYILGTPKSYADSLTFTSSLPGQTGNSGKFIGTNGSTASWGNTVSLLSTGNGTVGAPSLNLGDAATGNYRPALNQFALAINGTISELNQSTGKTIYGNLVLGTGITFPANMSQAQAQSAIGVPSVTGSGASGSWGINITGSAALASNITGVAAISNGGTGATSAGAARAALGSTTVGDAVFVANTAAIARAALGAASSAGTTTNDSAAAGVVGEFISSAVGVGSPVALTSAANSNVTSISLTAGDWDVDGFLGILPASTTSLDLEVGCTSAVSATFSTDVMVHRHASYVQGASSTLFALPTSRFSLASTTTIYLVAQAQFTVSTCGAFGTIRARRAR